MLIDSFLSTDDGFASINAFLFGYIHRHQLQIICGHDAACMWHVALNFALILVVRLAPKARPKKLKMSNNNNRSSPAVDTFDEK